MDILLHIASIRWSLPALKGASQNWVRWTFLVHTTGIYFKYKSTGKDFRQITEQVILFTATTFFGTYAEFACSSIHALPLMVLSITLLLNDVISWLSKADKAQTSVE